MKRVQLLVGVLGVGLCSVAGCGKGSSDVDKPYLERRRAHSTQLIHRVPAPQEYENEAPPRGVRLVHYPSGDLQLKAWLAVPSGPTPASGKWPGLVYFHGGFAFGKSDYEMCLPFLRAGYVVLCPMLRGENGNPGNFELFYGEVDDGIAAIKTLASQDNVDSERIYAFGHSAGGGITALLSLFDGVPLRHCGSAGGIYSLGTFDEWKDFVPFDLSKAIERDLRILLGHVPEMKRPHYAYAGSQDAIAANVRLATAESGPNGKFHGQVIAGDHFTSLKPALAEYLSICQQDSR